MLALLPAAAFADCNAPASDAERAQCVGHDLRATDTAINETYGELRAKLPPDGQDTLRHQEIAWIKLRAQTCKVDTKEPDRDKWIANLLHDFNKTVCVVRFTEQRNSELRAQLAALTPPAAAAPVPAPAAPPPPVYPQGDIYEVDAARTVSEGKYYFEVALNRAAIAQDASADVFIGVKGPGSNATGTLQTIHPHNVIQPQINVGIAIDLDAGKLYIRVDGAWRAEPGSAGGADLKLGRPYEGTLTSSVPIGAYLDRAVVDVNFGQHGFIYALPDGYVPLDTSPPRRMIER